MTKNLLAFFTFFSNICRLSADRSCDSECLANLTYRDVIRWPRLGTSRLHVLLESKFPFVTRIEFIYSKLSIFFCSCIRGHWRGGGGVSGRASEPH